MRMNQNPGKGTPDRLATSIHNGDTVSIPVGAPVVLVSNGTNDGIDVVLPTTSNSAQLVQAFKYGVASKTMAVGDFAEAVVFGVHNNLLLIRQTRASSTNTWNTEAARSVGDYLTVVSNLNGFITTVTAIGALTVSTGTVTVNVQTVWPDAVLMQTLASYASSASATSDTRTAITASVKAFVHLMF